MAPTLHRTMSRADLDTLLADAFSCTNTFEVEHLFEGAKDLVAWPSIQRALKLNDADSARLVLELKKADKGKGVAPPPPRRARHEVR